MTPTTDFTFPHEWTAEILPARTYKLPRRMFVYPRYAEDVERGALEVMVQPANSAEPFLATFALGFSDPLAPSGLWSCPDPQWLCAVAGGYAFLVNVRDPEEFTQVEYRPVLEVRALLDQQLLLFTGHYAITAWGPEGKAWETARLSSEGVQITGVEGQVLHGIGWDMMIDRDVPFTVDLKTGEHMIERS
ncbi:MAG: hypothetical protein ACRD3F_08470 [Acidobacteriaceae bacterium]